MSNQSGCSDLKQDLHLRREKVRELHFQGLSAAAIARRLNLPRTTIRRDLASFARQFRKSPPHDAQSTLAEELQRLHYLESEAWKAWQRSQQPATTEKTTMEETGERTKTKIEKTVQSQVGDRHLLELISQTVMRRCQLANKQYADKNDGQNFFFQFEEISRQRDVLNVALEQRVVDSFADVLAGFVREDSQPRALEARPTSGRTGRSAHGPGRRTSVEADRADAPETWEI